MNNEYFKKLILDEHLTDLTNARRLIERHGEKIRYIPAWQQWAIWNGSRWQLDESGEIQRLAKDTAVSILDSASKKMAQAGKSGLSKKEREAIIDEAARLSKWALSSQNIKSIDKMIQAAQSEIEMPVSHETFDSNHFILNISNGTIDLRTGQLDKAMREDYCLKTSEAKYEAGAQCPTWDAFLDTIFDGNQELIDYIQKAVGYMLTGSVSEQCLFLAVGGGRNGKSTFINVLRKLLGDYAQQADFSTFLERKDKTGPRGDIARMKGARMVAAVEGPEGKTLDESAIKHLTGDDRIAARFLYKEVFEFDPTHKIFLATNHRPIIKGTDLGIWRRLHFIPFSVTIPENKIDKNLSKKLERELPGILNWAIEGCLDWQKEGLHIPETMDLAKEDYRKEMDSIGNWINDNCITHDNATAKATPLYEDYINWSKTQGEHLISNKVFKNRMLEKGFVQKRRGGFNLWIGVGLAATPSV